MRFRTPAVLLAGVVAAAACERNRASGVGASADPLASTTPSPTPPSTTTASTTPSPTAPPTSTATPSPSASAILRSAVALEGGMKLPLAAGTEVVVAPSATFEVELSARTPDARLVLVDAREDLVAATSTLELSEGTRLTLSPTAPLVPGSRYALRVDGASGRDLHDGAGRAFSAVSLPLLAAGAPPPEEPKPAARRRKRR